MGLLSFLSRLLDDPTRLAADEFVRSREPSAPVLDVRSPREHAAGHLVGSINVDIHGADFAREIDRLAAAGTLSPEEPVYLYCRSGARSGRAARILREKGFEKAFNVGGLAGLRRAGAEVER